MRGVGVKAAFARRGIAALQRMARHALVHLKSSEAHAEARD
jgi:hypothetical protein